MDNSIKLYNTHLNTLNTKRTTFAPVKLKQNKEKFEKQLEEKEKELLEITKKLSDKEMFKVKIIVNLLLNQLVKK